MSGYLENGEWHQGWYDTEATNGEFIRTTTSFRHVITQDGAGGFPPVAGRYHLFVSLACPWAHRTLIVRALKKLEDVISVSVVDPVMSGQGWVLSSCSPDAVSGFNYLHEVYTESNPRFSGRVSVPVLWDKLSRKIVNNESSEIIRMFNGVFDDYGDSRLDLYPADLKNDIDTLNDFIYENINNGVYRCGFATTQLAYESAHNKLFSALDQIEQRLAGNKFLFGDFLTETDVRLFVTLARFDAVYFGHFKCNRNRIEDFELLSRYLREIYRIPGVANTLDIDHVKSHYYRSHLHINPTGIVPAGPKLTFIEATD